MIISGFRRLLGAIEVIEDERFVTIDGFATQTMTRDIRKIWKTDRINQHLFISVSASKVIFPKFFAPDVVYVIDQILNYGRRNSNVRALTKIRELLLEHTWLKYTQTPVTSRLNYANLKRLKLTPLEHQEPFFEAYDRLTQQYLLNGFLLAGAAGSGKTYIGLALSECLDVDVTLIFSPKRAIYRVWKANIDKHFYQLPAYWIADEGKPTTGKERYLIFHYETLDQALGMLDQFKGKRVMAILDESHNFNELTAQRTQKFIQLCQRLKCRDVVWASGTPIKALGSEAIPLLKTIDPFFTEQVEERFKKIYGRDAKKGLDILQHRLGLVSFKIEKKELKLEKPLYEDLPVVMPTGKDYTLTAIRRDMQQFIEERLAYYKANFKHYEAIYNDGLATHKRELKSAREFKAFDQYKANIAELRKGYDPIAHKDIIVLCNRYERDEIFPTLPIKLRKEFKNARSVVKYVGLKVQGECLGRVVGRKRIQCHVDMVPYVDIKTVTESTEKKTVVFSSYVEVVEALALHLKDQRLNPVSVYGKTNRELNSLIETFEKNEDVNPLIATFQSLSTAVPLVMADTVVMMNSPFRAHDYEQAMSRVHRLDATTQTRVFNVHLDTGGESNISTRSLDILAWSQEQVEKIMGVKSPFELKESMEKLTLTVAAEDYGLEETWSYESYMMPAQDTVIDLWDAW